MILQKVTRPLNMHACSISYFRCLLLIFNSCNLWGVLTWPLSSWFIQVEIGVGLDHSCFLIICDTIAIFPVLWWRNQHWYWCVPTVSERLVISNYVSVYLKSLVHTDAITKIIICHSIFFWTISVYIYMWPGLRKSTMWVQKIADFLRVCCIIT